MPDLFKKELELFFEKVVFHYLGNIQVFHQIERFLMEKLLLESLIEILNEDYAFEKIYRNYDCSIYGLNVISILFSIVGVSVNAIMYRFMRKSSFIIQWPFPIIRRSWRKLHVKEYKWRWWPSHCRIFSC